MYIVYKEIEDMENATLEKWYWCEYTNAQQAYEVAQSLCNGFDITGHVCDADEAEIIGVQNLPIRFRLMV